MTRWLGSVTADKLLKTRQNWYRKWYHNVVVTTHEFLHFIVSIIENHVHVNPDQLSNSKQVQ